MFNSTSVFLVFVIFFGIQILFLYSSSSSSSSSSFSFFFFFLFYNILLIFKTWKSASAQEMLVEKKIEFLEDLLK